MSTATRHCTAAPCWPPLPTLGAAPGPVLGVEVRGAGGEHLPPEPEGEPARLAVTGHAPRQPGQPAHPGTLAAALRGILVTIILFVLVTIILSVLIIILHSVVVALVPVPAGEPDHLPDPGHVLRHAGVHARLAAHAPALRLPEADDAEDDLAARGVARRQPAAAVAVAAVGHGLAAGVGQHQLLLARGADLRPCERPHGAALLGRAHPHCRGLHGVRVCPRPGARVDDQSEARDVSCAALRGEEGVRGPGEADGDGGGAVHVHLPAEDEQRQVVPRQDVVEPGGGVPARVQQDPGHRHPGVLHRALTLLVTYTQTCSFSLTMLPDLDLVRKSVISLDLVTSGVGGLLYVPPPGDPQVQPQVPRPHPGAGGRAAAGLQQAVLVTQLQEPELLHC